ncbi:transmembrane protein 231-like [Pollicipes pollicipes]|uniref:transmembrane protein 231-like n=1 Tax=Pollicipes pollicipes TaxID=41117 RepID=UPI0018849632|nr:transmembrane protein 231-like [Pollicipes pollicipes]
MGFITVWTRSPVVSYRSTLCSKGTIFIGLCSLLTFVPPLLIAYRSHGFWLKVDAYREQPDIHFKHNVMVIVDTNHPDNYLIWSTFPSLNAMVRENVRAPIVSSFEDDVNRDGKNDDLHFDLEFPLLDGEHVHGIKLLLGFDFKLYTMVRLHMDCLAYVASSSAIPSGKLTVLGDLKFHQREPLKHRGRNDLYNQDIIIADSLEPEDYDIGAILGRYAARNLTTHLDNQYFIWSPNGASSSAFLLRLHLKYPEQTIMYTPGVWQVLKMAWVQYLAILVVFAMIIAKVKEYVFTNQLVPTWNELSNVPKKYL